jgi:secreted PhoX family phosphatase
MLACDTATGEIRRFLTGPTNCEITGVSFTPDGRNLFISVQHPGETPTDRSDPQQPQKYSSWPDYQPNGRPRSANVVIRKIDGGVIGS